MGGASEDVRISYGDGSHPRDLIKSLEHKRKQLKLVLKGKFVGFTDSEKEHYASLGKDQIRSIIEDYSRRIKGLKKWITSQGKAVMSSERNKKKGWENCLQEQ